MCHIRFGPLSVVLLALLLPVDTVRSQGAKRVLLETKDWGSLSGKVTLLGRGVADVVVWIKPPDGTYFTTHDKCKKRKDDVVIETKNQAFVPRISICNPVYFNGKMEVETGQKVSLKNSDPVTHNCRALWSIGGFNLNLPAGQSIDVTRKLDPLTVPANLQCDIHPKMAARLFVFDHPYYAITKADGTFELPIVPAGAEVTVLAWRESEGFALWTIKDERRSPGQKMKLNKGANTLNFGVAK